MKSAVLTITVVLFVSITASFAQEGVRKKRPPRHEYGNVIINNSSEKNRIAPVVYNHWLHRSLYTCRLCHVDIGFAMEAGGTGITEEDNVQGFYCGACHDGKEAFAPEEQIAGQEDAKKNCRRCHSLGHKGALETNFMQFTKRFPRGRFGNGIDWLKAEDRGVIKLADYLEGISAQHDQLQNPPDRAIRPKMVEMPDIIFSHEKHSVWNGCEVCHPDIFGIQEGSTKFTMQDIFSGKYCGACHGKVAFPLIDCQRCHLGDVYKQ